MFKINIKQHIVLFILLYFSLLCCTPDSEYSSENSNINFNNNSGQNNSECISDCVINGNTNNANTNNGNTNNLNNNQNGSTAVDSDNDGLNDDLENSLGLNPQSEDSDNDGILDGFEVGNSSVPFNSDDDELIDALDTDSDNDGKLDSEEGISADSDCDGLVEFRDSDSGPASDCTVYPGQGVGNFVNLGDLLATVKTVFDFEPEPNSAEFSIMLLDDNLRVRFADINFNSILDDEDKVLSITVLNTFSGSTAEGLRLGQLKDNIEGRDPPEASVSFPASDNFEGGILSLYYTKGFSITFNESTNKSSMISVFRIYPLVPNGSFNPENGTVEIGNILLQCGDGQEGGEIGSSPNDYINILGQPDYTIEREVQISIAEVLVKMDFYTFFGIEFNWIDAIDIPISESQDPDELTAVFLFPPFIGKTQEGLGIGSLKSELESGLGLNLNSTGDFEGNSIFIYKTRSDKLLGVIYANNGQNETDGAVAFVLNYPKE